MSIFSGNEIIALATLTFGYLDSESGLNAALVEALDHLALMGFVERKQRPGLTTWKLVEVPPMAQAAVSEAVKKIEEQVAANG